MPVFWGLMAVTLLGLQVVDACTCMYAHPQTHFCKADFVIKARVKSEETIYTKTKLENGEVQRYPFERKYKVSISKVLKEIPAFQNVSHKFLYSSYQESVCGVSLQPNKYVLTGHVQGDKAYISLCDFKQEWSTLPVRMRKGFNFRYEEHCDCEINVNWRHSPKKEHSDDSCTLFMRDDPDRCFSKHAMCARSSQDGRCLWTRPGLWKSCMKKAREDAWREP